MNINVLSVASPSGMVNFQANSWTQRSGMKGILLIIVIMAGFLAASGQSNPMNRFRGMGGGGGEGFTPAPKGLRHDEHHFYHRFLDSSRLLKMDSEIYNFYLRYPLPPTYVDFGNIGTASHSLIFNPFMKPGWDGGWHAYDPYVFTNENAQILQIRPNRIRKLDYFAGHQFGADDQHRPYAEYHTQLEFLFPVPPDQFTGNVWEPEHQSQQL